MSTDNKNRKTLKNNLKGGDSVNTGKFAHIIPLQAKPLEVKVYNNNFDRALKAFRALVQKERILSAYKDKQTYEKPSDRRRRKRNESIRKMKELEFKEKRYMKNDYLD
jgi:small subunit ribosomal protein S21